MAGQGAGLGGDALLRSPSEAKTQTVWSNGLSPAGASGSNSPRSRRAAIAMPTALASPWPSGPVVISTPGCGGTPGARASAAPGAQRLQVVEFQAVAGQVELGVEGEAGVAAGEHEPVAAEPLVVVRVVPHHLLEQQVRRRREAHRGARVAVAGLRRRRRPGRGRCPRRGGRVRSTPAGRLRGFGTGGAVVIRRLASGRVRGRVRRRTPTRRSRARRRSRRPRRRWRVPGRPAAARWRPSPRRGRG